MEDGFSKEQISRLLDTFEPYLELSIGDKAKEIRKAIESGNVVNEYKKLGFLKKEEREDIAKIKLNYWSIQWNLINQFAEGSNFIFTVWFPLSSNR